MSKTRTETDTFGPIEVEASRYWGAQSQRSIGNFRIGWEKQPKPIVRALGIIKRAAAETNMALGRLDAKLGEVIVKAAQEVIDGKLDDHFPLVVWQTGSGTQSNMNANEAISNRAIEMMGGVLGSKQPVHPNDHVNMSQSSNDTYPTAMHIACAEQIHHDLLPALRHLRKALDTKAKAWAHIIKIGRTHTQDATPLTLGQEFSGYAKQVENGIARIEQTMPMLMELAQGGTAVGTGLNAPLGFAEKVAQRIAVITGLAFTSAPNKFEALAAHDAMVMSHGAIIMRLPCRSRSPTTSALVPTSSGLGELACRERARLLDHARRQSNPMRGADHGLRAGFRQSREPSLCRSRPLRTQCNPVMTYNFLQSVRLMADAAMSFTDHCVIGLVAREDNIKAALGRSLMLVTALAPKYGYDRAARIAKTAHKNGTTLREEAVKDGIPAEDFDAIVRPIDMIGPK
jgi:fumarate hydratase class II